MRVGLLFCGSESITQPKCQQWTAFSILHFAPYVKVFDYVNLISVMITQINICEAVVLVTGCQEVPFGGHFIGKNHSNNSEIKNVYFTV